MTEQQQGCDNQCPCKHLVEVKEKHNAAIRMLKQDQAHSQALAEVEVRELLKDYTSMNLQVKECLITMQQSAMMFGEGSRRMSATEKRLDAMDRISEEITKSLGEPFQFFVSRWAKREKLVITWAMLVTAVIIFDERTAKVAAWLKSLRPF